MTLHWWQHWFWITAATPAILLVLTSLTSVGASSPWDEATPLWTSTSWFQAAPSPGAWAIQRRLLGFAIPQAAVPVAGLPPVAPGVAVVSGDAASSTPTAVITPTVEAVIFTLSPSVADVHPPSVQSVANAQNKSSQTVNTASQKTPPAKTTRPKTLKTTVVAIPKSSMMASKLPPKTTTTRTTTTTSTSTTASPPVTPSTTTLPPESVHDTTSPDAEGSEHGVEQLMNDSPADVSAASLGPATAETSGAPDNTSSAASPPSAAKVVAPSTSTTTLAPVEEAPIRAESTRDLGIVHPGVSFDNASGLHRSSDDSHSGLDTGSITGIALGVLLFAVLVGSVSFVLYRRRFLNKPQTLNDKCSNPDSSGYIDDSTLRENSEEMYSLDNDSFLNSLEAMTIQNYWTDSVKHTKL